MNLTGKLIKVNTYNPQTKNKNKKIYYKMKTKKKVKIERNNFCPKFFLLTCKSTLKYRFFMIYFRP